MHRHFLINGISAAIVALAVLLLPAMADPSALDSLQKAVDDIVKESTPKEEKPKETSQPTIDPSNGPKETKLDDGSTQFVRADGVTITTKPDGTKEYKKRDGTKVTVYPSGERKLESADEAPKYLPPPVADEFKPHHEAPPTADPKRDDTGQESKAHTVFQMPEESVGDHAPWDELEHAMPRQHHAPPLEQNDSDNDTGNRNEVERYTPPSNGSDDDVKSQTRLPSGTEVFVRGSGEIQTRYSDGTVVTQYPGLDQVAITDPSGKTRYETPGQNGSVSVQAGNTKVTIDVPGATSYVENGNGSADVIGSNGAWSSSDERGSIESRNSDGSLAASKFTDPASGFSAIQRPDGTSLLFDRNNSFVGQVRREDRGVTGRDTGGNPIPLDKLFSSGGNTSAAQQIARARQTPVPGAENYRLPPSIFGIATQTYRESKRNGRLRSTNDSTSSKGKSDLQVFFEEMVNRENQRGASTDNPRSGSENSDAKTKQPDIQNSSPDILAQTLKKVDATIGKSDAERGAEGK